jgi:hypothetical protein
MIQRFKADALHDWAKKVSGIQTIWFNQRAPRPKPPYVGLNIIAGPRKVGDDNLRQDVSGVFYIAGMRYFTLSVNVYGENANEIAQNLVDSLDMPSIQELLRNSDIAIVSTSEVRVLDQLLETDVEGRSQFDFQFASSINKVDDGVGYIDKVEITNEIDDSTIVVNE